MKSEVKRQTVDLSGYPDLVVIYLGMRAKALAGIKTLIGFGPKISKSADDRPDGLLLHENLLYSLLPPHVGMRQYWRDFDSLEKWTRSEPHRIWWNQFLRNTGGTGFWHEAYFVRGGMEAIYIDIDAPVGFAAFAPVVPARQAMFSARRRMDMSGEPVSDAPLSEAELYGNVEGRDQLS